MPDLSKICSDLIPGRQLFLAPPEAFKRLPMMRRGLKSQIGKAGKSCASLSRPHIGITVQPNLFMP
jgi:hypothetical protein